MSDSSPVSADQPPIHHEQAPDSDRLQWTTFASKGPEETDDGADVVTGLTADQKWLPVKYFYDDTGSELFEKITRTDEYYLTRAESEILRDRSGEIAEETGAVEILELGSGSSRKTRTLLEAYGKNADTVRYLPLDVSGGMLKAASHDLVSRFPWIDVWGLVGTYEQALAGLPPVEYAPRMAVFLGSTIGNLNDTVLAEFLDLVRGALNPGAYFLVGMDLQKDPRIIEAAYNDADGLNAAFNLNMLAHLNARFGADFDLEGFRHKAFYNREAHQIELHLESLKDQTVTIADLDLKVPFTAGETIFTEISRKFHVPDIAEVFARHGFQKVRHWTDSNGYFGLVLFQAV